MTLSDASGLLKRFRKTPWRFQATFQTPLKDLHSFVATILSSNESITSGCVTIDKVVMDPKNLRALLVNYSLPDKYGHDWLLTASGSGQTAELLEAALSDWLDFLFTPTPKPFVIYADHDEYITFYSNTKSNLNLVVEPLLARGYKAVPNYDRKL